jgi:hypothetical protein
MRRESTTTTTTGDEQLTITPDDDEDIGECIKRIISTLSFTEYLKHVDLINRVILLRVKYGTNLAVFEHLLDEEGYRFISDNDDMIHYTLVHMRSEIERADRQARQRTQEQLTQEWAQRTNEQSEQQQSEQQSEQQQSDGEDRGQRTSDSDSDEQARQRMQERLTQEMAQRSDSERYKSTEAVQRFRARQKLIEQNQPIPEEIAAKHGYVRTAPLKEPKAKYLSTPAVQRHRARKQLKKEGKPIPPELALRPSHPPKI